MKFPDIECGKRLFLGEGRPIALGIGDDEIRGSAYMEGPVQMGTADAFSSVLGTLMIGREKNSDDKKQPPRSLYVKGNTFMEGDGGTANALNVTGNTNVTGDSHVTGNITTGGDLTVGGFASWSGSIVATTKLFDIKHPTKEGYRLAHACLEGPENGVYVRGKLKNHKIILLPEYWRNLINIDTITVQLQPIGAHQDIIVKRWDAEKVELQSKPGIPIHCFYHIFAERQDVKQLVTEYKGDEFIHHSLDKTS